jgi:hypothetical protein
MSTTAKAAEKDVESLLLRAGWITSVPSIDAGIDIVAMKGSRVIRVQVKSCGRQQPDGSYRFDLRKKTKSGLRAPRDWSAEVDYVFFVADSRLVWAAKSCECVKSAVHLREGDCLSALPQEIFA